MSLSEHPLTRNPSAKANLSPREVELSIVNNLVRVLDETRLYLTTTAYCELWSISSTRLDEMLHAGLLSERNGALAKGTGKKGAHKRIYRFFNPFLFRVDFPPLS